MKKVWFAESEAEASTEAPTGEAKAAEPAVPPPAEEAEASTEAPTEEANAAGPAVPPPADG